MASPVFRDVHVRAPGKLNLALSVGPRDEDGYHELATVFQAVSLYEDVYASAADRIEVSFAGSVDTSELAGADNTLVHRAARLVADEMTALDRERLGLGPRQSPGVRLRVSKNVPIAGGMGGGSADAAATLLACDAHWGLDLPRERLAQLAARLGSDVPFSLYGQTQLGAGRGDELTPVMTRGEFHWVLVIAPFGVSTPAVYGRYDELRPDAPRPHVSHELLVALRNGDSAGVAASMHNDLTDAAFDLAPQLAETINDAARYETRWLLSGSGPTLAFLTDDAVSARGLAGHLSQAGHRAVAVHGPVPGARFVSDL